MSEPAETVVRVTGLVKRYGTDTVLDGVDFTVERGEFVALTGRSGAGKSTLIHLLGALETPDAGTIEIDGVNLGTHGQAGSSQFRRRHVGIVFQLHNLVPRLTAVQNVELAMFSTGRSRAERHERAMELLRSFDLEHRATRRPPQLSGGERSRVALARGLANDPPLLLADEPTGSLDDEAAEVVAAHLRSLADDRDVSVLSVSHDPRLNDLADRTLRLSEGRIRDA
ncbi:MAG TPA: ABC transporter ATP-binding protein [Acidimicrobiales bacterium]|nr:ABC transporter ATP-binding protein [Acidimicrobiales bacterium]